MSESGVFYREIYRRVEQGLLVYIHNTFLDESAERNIANITVQNLVTNQSIMP